MGFEDTSPYIYVVNGDENTAGPLYKGLGVLDDTGTIWTGVDNSASNLSDSQGEATTVGMTLTGGGGYTSRVKNYGENDLTRDLNYGGTKIVTFSGLPANRCDLALFGVDAHWRSGATFAISGYESQVCTGALTDLNWEGFEEGDTHVIFEDVTPVSGEIVVTITGAFSGFQIGVYPPPDKGTVISIL